MTIKNYKQQQQQQQQKKTTTTAIEKIRISNDNDHGNYNPILATSHFEIQLSKKQHVTQHSQLQGLPPGVCVLVVMLHSSTSTQLFLTVSWVYPTRQVQL